MQLNYSPSGIPLILLENGARLSFSKTTETEKGYKYLCFNVVDTKTLTVSGAKAKYTRKAKVSENISFICDMKFKRDSVSGIPAEAKKFLSPITLGYLKNAFNELTVDGYFPRRNLKLLDEKFKELDDPSDSIDDDPTATESFDDVIEKKVKPKKKMKVKTRMIRKPKMSLTKKKK